MRIEADFLETDAVLGDVCWLWYAAQKNAPQTGSENRNIAKPVWSKHWPLGEAKTLTKYKEQDAE